jgi:hypothetical protein
MIRFWDSSGKPVLIMTGDLHNSWAVKVTDRVWSLLQVHWDRRITLRGAKGDARPKRRV